MSRLIHNYLGFAGLCVFRVYFVNHCCRMVRPWHRLFSAILLYDYLLTLSAEISTIWNAPFPTRTSLWFLVNRYPAMIGHIAFKFLGLANVVAIDNVRSYITIFCVYSLTYCDHCIAPSVSIRVFSLLSSSPSSAYTILLRQLQDIPNIWWNNPHCSSNSSMLWVLKALLHAI